MDYKELYNSLKTFQYNEDTTKIKNFLKNFKLTEEYNLPFFSIIKNYCIEHKLELDSMCLTKEDNDFFYYTIFVDNLPKLLLCMIEKFILLHEKNILQEQLREK